MRILWMRIKDADWGCGSTDPRAGHRIAPADKNFTKKTKPRGPPSINRRSTDPCAARGLLSSPTHPPTCHSPLEARPTPRNAQLSRWGGGPAGTAALAERRSRIQEKKKLPDSGKKSRRMQENSSYVRSQNNYITCTLSVHIPKILIL